MEAIRKLEEGVADAEAIDTAMELGYRHPMGPLRSADLVGLDVRLSIARLPAPDAGRACRAPATAAREGRRRRARPEDRMRLL
ncbi:3-hydroxyacyl-CoA dehydrogenase family protein [Blastococcus brunescens]|uniref:3-hydroxyacyl-CoA dehydrogenase family protein n=1 Tax=Blastococcus brunescens TaxID=1564165 RepID=A0ABZ1B836_9ACTN|nr:3-hydroxyacyl-CoA dehydrogenase family protein [Blastococcus sp. BMG 8361]WRL66542.1 3-hydroxyacyl-CoA dehydrogenase family protein [Blastococcus sp. BMG 8361]